MSDSLSDKLTKKEHNDSPSDIIHTHWIEKYLPEWARPFAYLARYDRPTGIWLLFIPCLWGILAVPPEAAVTFADGLRTIILFALGAVVMRGAGCTINDWWDKELDQKVKRTRSRPLAAGTISSWQTLLFLLLQLVIGFAILVQFNIFVVALGFIVMGLIFAYPLMKRFTYWPQFFLGITFNWGILMGWIALYPKMDMTPVLIYAAGILWTLVYDTIYAHQDKEDDRVIGIKSTALLFGKQSKNWLRGFTSIFALCLLIAGLVRDVSALYYFILAGTLWLMFEALKKWNPDDPKNCLYFFRAHKRYGLLIALAWLMALIL